MVLEWHRIRDLESMASFLERRLLWLVALLVLFMLFVLLLLWMLFPLR